MGLFDLLRFFKRIRIGFLVLIVTKDLKFIIVLKELDVIWSHSDDYRSQKIMRNAWRI
jgi:hypothetical protein